MLYRIAALSAVLLAGCGGSDSEPDTDEQLRTSAMARAEQICSTQGGVKVVTREFYSYSRNGSLLDVGLVCECHNGAVFRTPVRRE